MWAWCPTDSNTNGDWNPIEGSAVAQYDTYYMVTVGVMVKPAYSISNSATATVNSQPSDTRFSPVYPTVRPGIAYICYTFKTGPDPNPTQKKNTILVPEVGVYLLDETDHFVFHVFPAYETGRHLDFKGYLYEANPDGSIGAPVSEKLPIKVNTGHETIGGHYTNANNTPGYFAGDLADVIYISDPSKTSEDYTLTFSFQGNSTYNPSSATVSFTYYKKGYMPRSVSVSAQTGGTASADTESCIPGTTVHLTAFANTGYSFDGSNRGCFLCNG